MLNLQQQEAIQQIASNWRLTPATMATRLTNGGWIASPWLQYASLRVAHGIARGGARIIISAPPRHGKSELISVHTSNWVLENFPKRNVILTAYGADLAEQYGRRVRDQIRDHENLLNAKVRDDVSKVGAFQTSLGGYMYSVGLGGAITGRGAHVLLIDDYIKEIKEALSPAYRDYCWNWFVTTAMTRLEPGASVIIIATRWHSDDLIGRILKNFPGQWENIYLPAIAKENDLIGRKPGSPLFVERYGLDYLNDQKELLGTMFFNALYQQDPVDETSKMADVTWLKSTKQLPAPDFRWARIWDLAATQGAGDWTTGTLAGYSKSTNIYCIANIVRRQLAPGSVEDLVRKTAIADGLETEVLVEQEPGSSGKILVNHFDTNVLPEFKVRAVPAVNNKVIRAQSFLAACEAGKVYLLDDELTNPGDDRAGWKEHFTREFDGFPTGQFDDQIDTAAAGYNYLSGKKIFSASVGRRQQVNYKPNSKLIRKASFMLGTSKATRRATFGR